MRRSRQDAPIAFCSDIPEPSRVNISPPSPQANEPGKATSATLRDVVAHSVRRYLHDLCDHQADDLYEVMLREIEPPLLREVMRHHDGNQSRAAATLGLNRATLRKKLRAYGID